MDKYPRPSTTVATLAALKPAFKKDGSVTAGNASGINDGAAALVVTTGEKSRRVGTPPLARILSYVSTGVDPADRARSAPIPAVRKVLERAGLKIGDIDLFELNEAFAAQSLAVIRELGIDQPRLTSTAAAIALGHPIGASGARVLTTLLMRCAPKLNELWRRCALAAAWASRSPSKPCDDSESPGTQAHSELVGPSFSSGVWRLSRRGYELRPS